MFVIDRVSLEAQELKAPWELKENRYVWQQLSELRRLKNNDTLSGQRGTADNHDNNEDYNDNYDDDDGDEDGVVDIYDDEDEDEDNDSDDVDDNDNDNGNGNDNDGNNDFNVYDDNVNNKWWFIREKPVRLANKEKLGSRDRRFVQQWQTCFVKWRWNYVCSDWLYLLSLRAFFIFVTSHW